MNDLIGIPFKDLPCWRLVLAALPRFNIPYARDWDIAAHARSAISDAMHEGAADGHWVPVDAPMAGDVLLMGRRPGEWCHAGIFTEDGVLHTTRSTGSIIQSMAMLRLQGYTQMQAYRWQS